MDETNSFYELFIQLKRYPEHISRNQYLELLDKVNEYVINLQTKNAELVINIMNYEAGMCSIQQIIEETRF